MKTGVSRLPMAGRRTLSLRMNAFEKRAGRRRRNGWKKSLLYQATGMMVYFEPSP
jgi:hypothetical protein